MSRTASPDTSALVSHGLDFVAEAVERLASKPDDRSARYAVLHLANGTELLLKARLMEEHWSLVFADIGSARLPALADGDFKSVDFHQLLERLGNIASVTIADQHQKALSRLRDARNKVTHFAVTVQPEALRAQAAQVLSFLIDFIHDSLTTTDEHDELIQTIKAQAIEFKRFVRERWKQIKSEVDKLATPPVECPLCGQKAAEIDGGITCLFCHGKPDSDAAAEHHLSNVLGLSHYDVVKDGGEWPCHVCPECGNDTFVPADEEEANYRCFSCGVEYHRDDFEFCEDCSEPYTPAKDDTLPVCSDCYDSRLDRF
jgi:hypothetical protein